MDLIAWSPAVYPEIKRLCTRVPKKWNPKPSAGVTQTPATQAPVPTMQAPQFQFTFVEQVPQMPPLQSIPQVFQPAQFQPMITNALQDP